MWIKCKINKIVFHMIFYAVHVHKLIEGNMADGLSGNMRWCLRPGARWGPRPSFEMWKRLIWSKYIAPNVGFGDYTQQALMWDTVTRSDLGAQALWVCPTLVHTVSAVLCPYQPFISCRNMQPPLLFTEATILNCCVFIYMETDITDYNSSCSWRWVCDQFYSRKRERNSVLHKTCIHLVYLYLIYIFFLKINKKK